MIFLIKNLLWKGSTCESYLAVILCFFPDESPRQKSVINDMNEPIFMANCDQITSPKTTEHNNHENLKYIAEMHCYLTFKPIYKRKWASTYHAVY